MRARDKHFSLVWYTAISINVVGLKLKAWPNEDDSTLMRVPTLDLVWPETLLHSHRLSYALIHFERAQFFMRVDESFLSFVVTLYGLSSTLVLVWPELKA